MYICNIQEHKMSDDPYTILFVGNSCSGKTSTARYLSRRDNINRKHPRTNGFGYERFQFDGYSYVICELPGLKELGGHQHRYTILADLIVYFRGKGDYKKREWMDIVQSLVITPQPVLEVTKTRENGMDVVACIIEFLSIFHDSDD